VSICRVCQHAEVEVINALLAERVPVREIGQRFGLPKSNVARHRTTCLFRASVRQKAREAALEKTLVPPSPPQTPSSARELAVELRDVKDILANELRVAEVTGKGIPLNVIRELRSTLELLLKSMFMLESREAEGNDLAPFLKRLESIENGLQRIEGENTHAIARLPD
jgi:hypothetical protein